MTQDAEEYEDPDKIDIRPDIYKNSSGEWSISRGVGSYHVKRFFEEGLNALLNDQNFLLLYVPRDGAKMRIVRPAKDPYHRRRMIKRINEAKFIPSFYYALSHLWKITGDNRHLWHDIGNYVDDENGRPVDPVSMREEKRDTLLRMLEDSPDSYWWIDVLCTRSDTPLDIMGDIYACCLECIAMVDCEPNVIPLLHTMFPAKEDIPAITDSFCGLIELSSSKQLYRKKYRPLVERLFDFLQNEWWQRVWTWQEMALPFGDVRLMAETGTHRHTIALDDLLNNYHSMASILNSHAITRGDAEPSAPLRNLGAVMGWLLNLSQARAFTKTRIEKKSAVQLVFLMNTLGNSTRRCMNPVDYVYGVLGMLQIKIPRMDDPNAVWQSFLRAFENYIDGGFDNMEPFIYFEITGISDHAHQVNLEEVEHIGDVYKDFFTGTANPSKC